MPPTQNFEFADWFAMESLRQLINPLEIAAQFNTSYNSEFTKSYPIGATVHVPYPKQFVRDPDNTLGYTPQPIVDRHADVIVDRVGKVHFEWDSIEKALKMPRGREKIADGIIRPAMRTIRNGIETDAAQWAAQNASNVVGVLGTNPSSFDAVYGAAGQVLAEGSAPAGDHSVFLSPAVTRPLRATAIAQFNPVSDVSKMWRKGLIGEVNGLETYQSNSLYRHTAGTWAGAVTVTSTQTGTGAISSLTLTATTGDTFKRGDKFNIAGVNRVNSITYRSLGTLKQFTITNDNTVTAAGSSATITFSPPMYGPGSPFQNVDALPLATAALTLWPGTASPNGKTGTINLAIGDSAFALVSVPLDNPPQGGSVELSSQARDPQSGINVAVLRMFDGFQRKWINRIECIYGFGNFYNDNDAVAIASA